MSTGISCNVAVLHGHENLSFACIFKHCGLKENSFRYMYTLSVRLFLSAVREARTYEDGAHRAWYYF